MLIEQLNKKEKEILTEQLEKYGIEKINGILIKFGKEKNRIFTGDISMEKIRELNEKIRVMDLGLYFSHGDRLSLDIIHLLKIKKNILELDEEQAKKWFLGEEIEFKSNFKNDFYVLKSNDDFIGVGFLRENRILNFMPKERRTKII